MWKRLHVKCPLFLSDFNKTCIFSTEFQKSQISNCIKIRPVGTEVFHADRQTGGQTDMTQLIIAFRSFANTPKTRLFVIGSCYPSVYPAYRLQIQFVLPNTGKYLTWILHGELELSITSRADRLAFEIIVSSIISTSRRLFPRHTHHPARQCCHIDATDNKW
jgi:hypothetical protein